MDGIIVVNKEQGYTSFDVVAKLRGILKIRKMGHTGTLDPMATGVLPVCLGAGTKLCDMMTDSTKIYRCKMLLGKDFDTEDVTGELLHEAEVKVSEEELRDAVSSFIGEIEQLPPMYSAVKVAGKKLCDYARAGKDVERKPRKVRIDAIDIEEIDFPYVTMKVTCSKGTYIRSLCREIGLKLGCYGCMAELVRLYTGGFALEQAKTIDEIEKYRDEGRLEELLFGVDSFFKDYPEAVIKESSELYADNGNPMMKDEFAVLNENETGKIRLYRKDGYFYGVYRFDLKKNLYVPEKMFFCVGREYKC